MDQIILKKVQFQNFVLSVTLNTSNNYSNVSTLILSEFDYHIIVVSLFLCQFYYSY